MSMDEYDDEHVHYAEYFKPSSTCTARKSTIRTTRTIKDVTCPGCMKQYIVELPPPTSHQYDWYDGK